MDAAPRASVQFRRRSPYRQNRTARRNASWHRARLQPRITAPARFAESTCKATIWCGRSSRLGSRPLPIWPRRRSPSPYHRRHRSPLVRCWGDSRLPVHSGSDGVQHPYPPFEYGCIRSHLARRPDAGLHHPGIVPLPHRDARRGCPVNRFQNRHPTAAADRVAERPPADSSHR
jgi:hypothetical protein